MPKSSHLCSSSHSITSSNSFPVCFIDFLYPPKSSHPSTGISSSTPQTQTHLPHPRLPVHRPLLPRYVPRQNFLTPHPSSCCHFTVVVVSVTLLSIALLFALSDQQRLKLYNKVPPNGLVLYTGLIVTEDGKEKKVTFYFEPFRLINAFLYLCDNEFHTEALNELLESDFIVMDGDGTLFGTLSENTREVLHQQLRQVHHVGRPNEIQLYAEFADENMVITVALEQVGPNGIDLLRVEEKGKEGEGDEVCLIITGE